MFAYCWDVLTQSRDFKFCIINDCRHVFLTQYKNVIFLTLSWRRNTLELAYRKVAPLSKYTDLKVAVIMYIAEEMKH